MPSEDDHLTLRQRGLACLRAGEIGAAIALLAQAAESAPDDGGVHVDLGMALQAAKRHQEALACFARGAPGESAPLAHAAFSWLALGDAAKALSVASAAIELAPRMAHAHFARGQALLVLDALGDAERAFMAALDISPAWADAWVQCGVARFRRGAREAAEAAFRSALRLMPGHAAAAKHLSELLATSLQRWRPETPEAALGMAVAHLSAMPAFARLPFGEWTRVLTAQIARDHYLFAVDSGKRIQGFLGWALTREELAESWVEGRASLRNDQCLEGDCVIINAWAARTLTVNRFLVETSRELFASRRWLYFKRHYADGRVRTEKISVNDFVAAHSRRARQRQSA